MKCECGGSENLGHTEGCTAHSSQPSKVALAEELREFTAMKYAGDCRCGKCQLVPCELIDRVCAALQVLDWTAGIELAAKYHDRAALDCRAIAAVNHDNKLGSDCEMHAIDHDLAASDLREIIEFGDGWAKVHYPRQVTEEDRKKLTALF